MGVKKIFLQIISKLLLLSFMILGIGVDIVEKARIRKSVERWGNRFLIRILTPREMTICQKKGDRIGSIAARIAAKEAVFKALGTGWAKGVGWQDVEIITGLQGEPRIRLYRKTKSMAKGGKLHLTLSHERDAAIAFVILEK
jgi:holo-[acyl-carrier protein] synthase